MSQCAPLVNQRCTGFIDRGKALLGKMVRRRTSDEAGCMVPRILPSRRPSFHVSFHAASKGISPSAGQGPPADQGATRGPGGRLWGRRYHGTTPSGRSRTRSGSMDPIEAGWPGGFFRRCPRRRMGDPAQPARTQVLRLPGWNPVMMRRTVSLTFWPTGVEGMRLETVSSLSIYTFTMSARRLADALVRARPPRLRPPGAAPPAPAAAWNRTSAAENSSRSSAHRREKEARGSDPRLPRLTIEQGTWVHMWGATPCTPFGLPRLDYRPRGGYVMVVAARRWRQAARANSVQMHSVQMHSVSPARRSSSHVPQPLALWDVWSRTAAHFVHAGVMPARVRRYSFGRK